MGAAAAAADGSGVAAVRSSAAADDRCVADVRASAAADDDDGRGAAAAKGRGGGQHDEFECNGTRKIESDTPKTPRNLQQFGETWVCCNALQQQQVPRAVKHPHVPDRALSALLAKAKFWRGVPLSYRRCRRCCHCHSRCRCY